MIVRFEFHGGFNDGNTVVEDDSTPIHDAAARRYLFLTDNGRVGAWFREVVPLPPDCQGVRIQQLMKEIEDLRAQLRELRGEPSEKQMEMYRELCKKLAPLMKAAGPPLFQRYRVANREIRGEETLVRLDFVSEES
jgi:hypothetical protein